ncbi:L,D-transpeptidase family protein [Lapidilactobacillus achengensis]|uniref:L,D-transpeptidase family protein n=1 Tax=Lapidilactobacillus achengensis TaxID=2486000 RepID=A0ABW1UQD2_9LACO|nr:L,D-transpeptidase family protein [Lapidilactobacillus achengensis]
MRKKSKIILAAAGFGLVLLFGGLYIHHGVYYQDHFLPKTEVENVNISKLTYAEAKQKLTDELQNSQYQLLDDKKELATISGKELGLTQQTGTTLKKIMAQQNPWGLSSKVQAGTDQTNNNVTFSTANLQAFVNKTTQSLNQNRSVTKNATLIKTDNGFKIKAEVQGNQIDAEKLMSSMKTAISKGQRQIQVSSVYIKPAITKSSSQMQTALRQVAKIEKVSGTYTIAGQTEKITSSMIRAWLTYQNGQPTLDQTAVGNYLRELNSKYATYNKTRRFQSTKRGIVSVPAGIYGWSINVSAETANLTSVVLAGKDFTRTPTIQGSGYSKDGTDIGNTYVEVDKVNQHMYVYINGALKVSTDIVTGQPGQDTPVGVWSVWAKERNSTLKGKNNDGSSYASPVSYWMPIDTTGVGIHDSSWQPKYGGDWYKTHGSHGCINTPPKIMAQVFELVPKGTAVIVF